MYIYHIHKSLFRNETIPILYFKKEKKYIETNYEPKEVLYIEILKKENSEKKESKKKLALNFWDFWALSNDQQCWSLLVPDCWIYLVVLLTSWKKIKKANIWWHNANLPQWRLTSLWDNYSWSRVGEILIFSFTLSLSLCLSVSLRFSLYMHLLTSLSQNV